jgi:hypothetical protein
LTNSVHFEGVKRIALKVAADFEKICGILPEITEKPGNAQCVILFATLGKSPLTDKLTREGKFDTSFIRGKREVYQINLIDGHFEGVSRVLLVCGSNKAKCRQGWRLE